jgi:anti-sigma-K factor RskA
MKGFEKEKNQRSYPIWESLRFYVIILVVTAIILFILISLNHAAYLLENILPAVLSLLNAIVAYIITKQDQGNRTYKQMMNRIKTWTIIRFVSMALIIVLAIITQLVEPLQFIFSFIGFYILHQVIEISILQKEVK